MRVTLQPSGAVLETLPGERILDAAQQAGVSELIDRLPQGIDTPVGEGDAKISSCSPCAA